MSGARAPLLRSPPFPWVTSEVAAVSRRVAPSAAAPDPERADRLIAAVRAARVGGDFWRPPADPLPPGTLVLQATTEAEARHLLAEAGGGPHVVLCAPAGAKAWDLPVARILPDAIDPWSLLAPGIGLAVVSEEWRLIGRIAGADLIGDTPTPAALADALIGHVAYRDPFTGQAASAEEIVALLADWRAHLDANRAIGACAGMAWWKKARIAEFLWTGRDRPLAFASDGESGVPAAGRDALAVWPSRVTPDLIAEAEAARVPIVRVEDGFIRSVGLGANLLPPFSIVVDRGGLYYDPGLESDLEHLLRTAIIPSEMVERAGALAALIVKHGISKYGSAPPPPPAPRTRRTVLVIGQVEDDLSVKKAGGDVAGNLGLLRRARAAEPDAYLLFKPHPDVDAGHRVGAIPDADALGLADEVVRAEATPSLLARVDAVHVLTSLVGFEALLRGLETHVHGSPFYAGWGLTRDHGPPLPRRTRRRTLGELAAATLILYPRYLDPVTRLPCPPEVLLARFAAGWKPRPSAVVLFRRWQGRIFKLFGRATS
ncbi:beta-3-deoxy-D-manno-oct-2-ulosonic acid transferase [Sphingomonas sp. AP4-R1]|uniref:capsular polysaccharide export protein, LipB/KpsS family n=1 Tax=Sphingomonas sp. AP4-R1 TaxID=2735134 RepID=UPI00149352FF|nr:beta-3-deoxy-D-manno-oct-2-ulosonic acid transferase [Sphingomonas sp. AP4-R1]QJU57633.1 beta-3-deoxy-D-manno-oct-2-ulosonic acid transferase [Sphingomonas sp. AP4-R1]